MRNLLPSTFKVWFLLSIGFVTAIDSLGQGTDSPLVPLEEETRQQIRNYFQNALPENAKRKLPTFKFSTPANNSKSSARVQAGPQWEKLHKESEGGIADDIVNVNGRLFLNYYSELFVSDDDGATWSVANGLSKKPLAGYYYTTDKKIIVSGNNILFFNQLSTDGGNTWTEITINTTTLPTYYFGTTAITLIGTDLYLGTYYNGMFKSSDLGKTWMAINNGYPNQYGFYSTTYTINEFKNQPVVANAYGIYRFDGNSWINSTGTGLPLYTGNGSVPYYVIQGVDINNSSMIATTHAGVYHSDDLGVTWEKYNLPDIERPTLTLQYLNWSNWPPLFYNVEIVNGIIYAIYENDFYSSANAGSTWTHSKLPDRVEVNHVSSAGSSLLLATKDGVYKSTDNGTSWQSSNSGFERKYYSSIKSNGKNSFMAPNWGRILHSTDGKAWSPFDKGLNPHAVGEVFFDDQTAYLNTYKAYYFGGTQQAQEDKIFSTDLKADAWTSVSSDFLFNRVYDLVVSGNDLYAVGFKNSVTWAKGIQYSPDKGKSWSTIFSGITHNNFKSSNYNYEDHVVSVHLNQDTLYAGTFLSGIFKSGDKGATWTAMNNGLKLAETDITDPNAILTIYNIQKKSNLIYFTAERMDDATIFYSLNWGKDWQEIDLSGVAPAGAEFLWSSEVILFDRQVIVQPIFVDENYNILSSSLLVSSHDNKWTQFGPTFPGSYGISLAKIGSFIYVGAATGGVYRIPFSDDETVVYAASLKGRKEKEITVPIKVNSFTNILSTQFSLSWDSNVATFVGTEQYGLSGIDSNSFGVVNATNGTLTFSWSDTNLQPKTLQDSSVLFAVRFKLIGSPGSTSSIAFTNDVVTTEIIGSDYEEKDYRTVDGSITLSPEVIFNGRITHHQSGLDAIVSVKNNLSEVLTTNTDASGRYKFDVPAAVDYELTAGKGMGQYLDYLNEADATRIRRHILQTDVITSPFDKIAADVNQSKTITTLDILHLEAVLLGLQEQLPGGAQWKFIPSDFSFDVANPFNYSSHKIITNAIDDLRQDFIAVHLGDVMDSENSSGRITDEDQVLKISLRETDKEGEVDAVITGYGFKNTSALQIGFEWDATIEYIGLEKGAIQPRANCKGNLLRLLWDDERGREMNFQDGTHLLTLRFKIDGDKTTLQNSLKLSSSFSTQSFDKSLHANGLSIAFEEAKELSIGNPYPNPFQHEIKIPVTVNQQGPIQITVLDVTGRKLDETEINGEAGRQEIVYKQAEELPVGFYLIKIFNGGRAKTVKMIKQ